MHFTLPNDQFSFWPINHFPRTWWFAAQYLNPSFIMTHYSQYNILKIQQFKKKHCRSPENSQQETLLIPRTIYEHCQSLNERKWSQSNTSTAETLQLNCPDVAPYSCLTESASNTHSKAEYIRRILHFSVEKGSSVPMCTL